MDPLQKIFNVTKTIAVVGLSPDVTKPSHRVARFMHERGFKIIPIYPKEQTILGERVYRSLDEVEVRVDMVNMFRKGEFANELLEQIKKRDDVKSLWLQLGIINQSAICEALEIGLGAIEDKCLMIEYKRIYEC